MPSGLGIREALHVLLLVVVTAVLLSAPAGAKTLTIATVEGSEEDWSTILEEFRTICSGADAEIKPYPSGQLKQLIVVGHMAGNHLADVLMIHHSWLRELAEAGAILDLSSYTEELLEGAFICGGQGLTPARVDGRTYGLPFRPSETWKVCAATETQLLPEVIELMKIASESAQAAIQVSVTARNEVEQLAQNLGDDNGIPLLPINPVSGKGRAVEITVLARHYGSNEPAVNQEVTVYSTLRNESGERIAAFDSTDQLSCADGSVAIRGTTDQEGQFVVRLRPLDVSETDEYKTAVAALTPTHTQRRLKLRGNFGAGIGTIRIGADAQALWEDDWPTYSEVVRVKLFEVVAAFKEPPEWRGTFSPYVEEACSRTTEDCYDTSTSHGETRVTYQFPGVFTDTVKCFSRGGLCWCDKAGILAEISGSANGSAAASAHTPLIDGWSPWIRTSSVPLTEDDPFMLASNKIVAATAGYTNAPIALRTRPPEIWTGGLQSAGLAFHAEVAANINLYAYNNAPYVNPGSSVATTLGALLTFIPGTSPLFNIGSGALLSKLAEEINGNAWLTESLAGTLFGERNCSAVANFAASVSSVVPGIPTDMQNDGETITLSPFATKLRNDCTPQDLSLMWVDWYTRNRSTREFISRTVKVCARDVNIGNEPLEFNRQFRNREPLPVGPDAERAMLLDFALTVSALRSSRSAYASIHVNLSEPLLRIVNVRFDK